MVDSLVEIVAEIACSHNGDVRRVKRMIYVAEEAGADAIQLQIFYNKLPELQFTYDEWKDIVSCINRDKLKLYFTPYDIKAFRTAVLFKPDGYKIHGCNYDKDELLDAILRNNKPIHLMVGGKTLPEIKRMIRRLNRTNITLLHGIQLFPTPIHATNLDYFNTLKNLIGDIGLADHIDGYDEMAKIIPLMALPYGISVIEKHISVDRKGYDREAALLPADFREFVRWVRKAENALGEKVVLTPQEKLYRAYCDEYK